MKIEMPKENLEIALSTAIRSLQSAESKVYGTEFESAMVAGWKNILSKLRSSNVDEIRLTK